MSYTTTAAPEDADPRRWNDNEEAEASAAMSDTEVIAFATDWDARCDAMRQAAEDRNS